MVARNAKAATPDRDNTLLARIEETARQPGLAGFTLNRDGYESVKSEIDAQGRLFGYAVFIVLPQPERVLAHWGARSLSTYLARFKLRTSNL